MAKRNTAKNYNLAELQPDDLNALKEVVKEYISRKENIENEIGLLKEDLKELDEEFCDKLDMKTLNVVMRIIRLEQALVHRDTADMFKEVLTDPAS